MSGLRRFGRARERAFLTTLITSLLMLSSSGEVRALDTKSQGLKYHAQVTSYYCGSATVEMMLDNNAVRNTNPFLNYILNPANAPDPAPASFVNVIPGQDATFGTIPFNAVNNIGQSIHPTFAQRVIPGLNGGNPVSAVTYGPQLAIYDIAHGAGTFTPIAGPNTGVPLSYYNGFQPWGSGSGINGQQVELNIFDNPNVGGEGNHAFTAFNLASQNVANRTIANAIGDFNVPAGGVFYGGQHAMAITGVKTDAQPGKNLNYDIEGFYISDPWRGYAVAKGLPAKQWGRREHDYISNVPEVGQAKSSWEQIFNKSGSEPGEGAYAQGLGYKFVVEPLGPETVDDGLFDSTPLPAPALPVDLNAAAALALAQTTLAADSDLSTEYGLSGGAFDAAGMQLLDPTGGNDWFIPYLKGGAYTGVFMLSAHYGILEEASWDEAGETATSLANLQLEYQGLEEGFNPNDNPVPEATTLALAAIGLLTLGGTRRRLA